MPRLAVPLSTHPDWGRRHVPVTVVGPDRRGYASLSSAYGLDGRLGTEPLELSDHALYALAEAEFAARQRFGTSGSAFYDGIYDRLAPYSGRAADVSSCQLESLAAWLALWAREQVGAQEREARKLIGLLDVVVHEDGWRQEWRNQGGSLSHQVFNRPQTSQAGFAVAGAGAALAGGDGGICLERVSQHVFRALAEAAAHPVALYEPLVELARLLSHGG